jgi:hypothetical protein
MDLIGESNEKWARSHDPIFAWPHYNERAIRPDGLNRVSKPYLNLMNDLKSEFTKGGK